MSDPPKSWARTFTAYLRKFGNAPMLPEDLHLDRMDEARVLLQQAIDMNRPFKGDDDFRRALGLGPKTSP
jgi:hypothetical protein